ncbi:unnamed protein product, partial [Staurois parvus]
WLLLSPTPPEKIRKKKRTRGGVHILEEAIFGGHIQSKGGPRALNIPERRFTHHYLVSAVNVGFAQVDDGGIPGTEESNENIIFSRDCFFGFCHWTYYFSNYIYFLFH